MRGRWEGGATAGERDGGGGVGAERAELNSSRLFKARACSRSGSCINKRRHFRAGRRGWEGEAGGGGEKK